MPDIFYYFLLFACLLGLLLSVVPWTEALGNAALRNLLDWWARFSVSWYHWHRRHYLRTYLALRKKSRTPQLYNK